ncbi:FxDxF family PEP-CTERM protein [Pelomonas sp. UHG3]|uniref:FxDxF family PEP-CTERM protein n=1 Tax=Roseateles hydrophilus TaxID=2975054 RepID=A0ACC6CB44_9BURK|nr:FxDxF family PEP-CTERM protein [Pelomonas sp. UHG3]MCY4745505.1 FxDxF family PEP-CTERM protein [Pelomonas sp. UHG3]
MTKSLTALALAALAALPAHAALTAGDIAFTSFNADEKGWSFVTFVDIAANTTIYFSDNEWQGSAFNTGEGYQSWNSGTSTIAAGTVIRFSSIQNSGRTASVGTLSTVSIPGNSGGIDLSSSGDGLYAFIGSAASPSTFLAAITNTSFNTAATGVLTGTALTTSAFELGVSSGSDWAQYTGARTGQTTMAGYKALVADKANWTINGDGSFATEVPTTTAFVATPVPEPQTYALMLGGLGLVGWMARRRKAA